jgi:tRNA (Thr-GGU) A37 N-methylase
MHWQQDRQGSAESEIQVQAAYHQSLEKCKAHPEIWVIKTMRMEYGGGGLQTLGY